MRKVPGRLYPFEPFLLAHLLLLHLLLFTRGIFIADFALLYSLSTALPTFTIQLVTGVVVRLLIEWRLGTLRSYVAAIRSRAWLTDSARLLFFAALIAHGYSWLKLFVPLINPALYDQQLADIDEALLLGLNPNAFFLNLFSNRAFLQIIDWSYATLFLATLFVGFSFFLSSPDREKRLRFIWGSALLWITGAWLYLALPSLGPAYAFGEIWSEVSSAMPRTNYLLARLMKNYTMVMNMGEGVSDPSINPQMGIGAFPSLHVAFHSYLFLWMRGINKVVRFVFGFLVFLIAVGSVITGWHYLIDSIAGALLAWAAYAIALRVPPRSLAGETTAPPATE